MKLIKEDEDLLYVQCTLCKKEFTIDKEECIEIEDGYEVNENVKCSECANEDRTIIDYDKMLGEYNVTEKKNNIRSFEEEKRIQLENENTQDIIKCPKCNSTQLTSNKTGFGLGKAVGGAVLFGGVGLLGGFIGSKKVIITCLKCGHNWKAGNK